MSLRIRISLPAQTLELRDQRGRLLRQYPVSTAKNGAGEQNGSYRTPRGKHLIRAKIGAGQAENTVFVRRRPTGELWTPALGEAHPRRDWILTRILWLSGREPGFNRLGAVDTMRRYVYLHGSPDVAEMGVPGSHGCVRMRNRDIVELFDLVPVYTPVDIVEFALEAGPWMNLAAEALALRVQVFVVEQGVPADMELDEYDPLSTHVLARDAAGRPIGTGRLLPDGHIGRLAVLPEWRGKGVGRALFEALLDQAASAAMGHLALHAQTKAAGFYQRFGFDAVGAEFIEAGIPHQLMVRKG